MVVSVCVRSGKNVQHGLSGNEYYVVVHLGGDFIVQCERCSVDIVDRAGVFDREAFEMSGESCFEARAVYLYTFQVKIVL